jgi:DNA-binding transcriptional LysR family regulator
LETFLHAAEHLSFSEAARQLHLTQPTVSHHIKSLEKAFGIDLFERTGNSLRLTEAGHLLLPWAKKVHRDAVELREMMDALQEGIAGDLRIACSTTAGKYVLPQLAARFCMRYPGINVSIMRCTPEDVTLQLIEGEANLGVVSTEINTDDVEIQVIFEDQIELIVPAEHPWTVAGMITPAEILDEPMIMRETTSGTRRVMLTELGKFDISIDDLNIFMELGNAEAIVRTVAAGYGVSFVSTLATDCQIELGNVAIVKVDGLDLRRKLYMVRKRMDSRHRFQEVFWSFVHDPSNEDLLYLAS